MDILKEILLGAQEKCQEAGIPILGGHTIDDEDPKYGLVVTGRIHPDRILSNDGARPGDVLILTKPVGTGIITSGIKQGKVAADLEERVIRQMATLNKTASETMLQFPVSSVTDVTGFGLMGHLSEMTRGSRVTAEIKMEAVPVLPGVEELARNKVIPAGTKNNLDYTSPWVHYGERISDTQKLILNDAQTSGGLLIAIPEKESGKLQDALTGNGVDNWIIGKITKTGEGEIFIV
jgi:selenide,water dikinase